MRENSRFRSRRWFVTKITTSAAGETAGTQQFRPLINSSPYLGQQGKITQVREFKVEMLCDDQHLDDALTALVSAHPYEQPAFEYWRIGISRTSYD